MDGWVGGWVGGWMGGWVGGWMDGWVGGWMGGWMEARKSLGKSETSLKGDVLTISGSRYTTKNINTLKGDLHPKCFSRKNSVWWVFQ